MDTYRPPQKKSQPSPPVGQEALVKFKYPQRIPEFRQPSPGLLLLGENEAEPIKPWKDASRCQLTKNPNFADRDKKTYLNIAASFYERAKRFKEAEEAAQNQKKTKAAKSCPAVLATKLNGFWFVPLRPSAALFYLAVQKILPRRPR